MWKLTFKYSVKLKQIIFLGARFLEEVWHNNNIILELSRVHIYLQPSAQRWTRHVDDLTWPVVLIGRKAHGLQWHGQWAWLHACPTKRRYL